MWRKQSLQTTLAALVLLKEVRDNLPPGSLGLLFCPPVWGQECGVQKRRHTAVVHQEERGLQGLLVSLGKQQKQL